MSNITVCEYGTKSLAQFIANELDWCDDVEKVYVSSDETFAIIECDSKVVTKALIENIESLGWEFKSIERKDDGFNIHFTSPLYAIK